MVEKYKFKEVKKQEDVENSQAFQELVNRLQKDPVYLATLAFKLSEEKQSMNLMLKEINQKLEKLGSLEKKLASYNGVQAQSVSVVQPVKPTFKKSVLLPEADEKIMALVKSNGGQACAEDVQKALKYKGKNAASSRLNRLVVKGLLTKEQVGRKVYFILVESL